MPFSLPSWKSYGGVGNNEKNQNGAYNNLVVDNLCLRNAYQGYFNICGELIVENDVWFHSAMYVDGSSNIHGDEIVLGNQIIYGSSLVDKTLDVSGDATIWGNLIIKKDFSVGGNLNIKGNVLRLNLVDASLQTFETNLISTDSKLALNPYVVVDTSYSKYITNSNKTDRYTRYTLLPNSAAFQVDLNKSQTNGIQIQTLAGELNNTLGKLVVPIGSGLQDIASIVTHVDASNSTIGFFHETSQTIDQNSPDSYIHSQRNGNLNIGSSQLIFLSSSAINTHGPVNIRNPHPTSIGIDSSFVCLSNIYQKPELYLENGLTVFTSSPLATKTTISMITQDKNI